MATFVCTSSHGQHTHSARTNLHLVVCTPPSCPPPWQFYQLLPKISFGCLTYNHIHISGLYSVLYMFRQTIAPFNVLCVCGISWIWKDTEYTGWMHILWQKPNFDGIFKMSHYWGMANNENILRKPWKVEPRVVMLNQLKLDLTRSLSFSGSLLTSPTLSQKLTFANALF